MWSETWTFLTDQKIHTSNNTVFIFVDLKNLSHRPTVSCCICLNQSNIIYFEIPLLCSPFWSWVDRNSFLHLDQNSSAKCCTLLHCLLLYKSGLTDEPGGGIITLLLIVNMLLGDIEVRFCESLFISTVRGREFTTASTSVIRVWKDSSFRHVP